VKREDLEHIIRAAATISGEEEIMVLGSQAMLASFPDAPGELLESMDADIFPLRRPDLSDKLDGAIGEFSPFHEMYGYYAHGVGPETFKAPDGWQQRLIRVQAERAGRRPAVGWCLEPHDLVASKCAARRERDWAYAKVCIEHGLVDRDAVGTGAYAADPLRRSRSRALRAQRHPRLAMIQDA
jgi:hypothetical protein